MRAAAIFMAVLLACLLAVSPQPAAAFEQASHQSIASAAFLVLEADGKGYGARVLDALDPEGEPLSDAFLRAVWDADRLDLCRNHYYDPYSGQGLAGFEDAATLCARFFASAEAKWTGNWEQSIYELGRAAHLLEDCSLPHHVHLDPLNGHAEFEAWLGDNLVGCLACEDGWYGLADDPGGLCRIAALAAYPLYDEAASGDVLQYASVAAEIVPDACRSTAALIDLFMADVAGAEPTLVARQTSTATRIDLVWTPCTSPLFDHYEVYVSGPNAHIEAGATLVGRCEARETNAASLERIGAFGDYEFAVVTVLDDGTALRGAVLRVENAGAMGYAMLIVMGGTTAVAAAALVFTRKGKR